MKKLKILMICFLCLPWWHVTAETVDFIGVTNYKKFQIIVSQIDGIVESLPINNGQQLKSSQYLFSVKPFDPMLKIQQGFAPNKEMHVIKLLTKEGNNVSRYQPIAQLGQKQDIHVVAKIYVQQDVINIGSDVSVVLDPDGHAAEVSGKIAAYEPFSDALLSGYQVEISLDMMRCLTEQSCREILKPGLLARISLPIRSDKERK
jgi:multidrug resistance efflux pump